MNLSVILTRGKRWNAVTLLDEADVYVRHRGEDLQQNAIVGVFLRTLEYHSGVLFLTTNRGDLVDDAIQSRCTVRIPYDIPSTADQKRIWKALIESNGLQVSSEQIEDIVSVHSDLSGRDIKNLLKLAMMVYDDPAKLTAETISEMRIYKATATNA